MKMGASSLRRFAVFVLFYLLCVVPVSPQQLSLSPAIPDRFDFDLKTAARLRPLLFASSTSPSDHYRVAVKVFQQLLRTLPQQKQKDSRWELRISQGSLWNAFSSPDGAIYVDQSLAELAGSNAGLWAAVLSHEMAHVLHRDWARRYLYEKSLQEGATGFALGERGAASASWLDANAASAAAGSFCRRMEFEADAESVTLMAHAGYHPDFTLALYHLLRAEIGDAASSSYAMHPRWEMRDRQLKPAYIAAAKEFDRLWPDRGISPGGNPPVVVFAEQPVTRTMGSGQWQVRIALHCENLVGTVEVVLQERKALEVSRQLPRSDGARELTGCTSDRTLITLTLSQEASVTSRQARLADVYVLDDQGSILSRSDVSGLRR